LNPPKRTEVQTPAQYEATRREWARDSKLCASCISTGSDRKPGFAIDRKTGKYRIDPVTRKRIRKETCDV
jgi:hypothetical protein